MAVEQDEQRIAGDRLPALVHFLDRAARQLHPERAHESRLPRRIVHLTAVGREPCDVLRAANAPAVEIFAPAQRRLRAAETHQLADELEQRAPVGVEVPVDPGDLVVLAVRVVVAALRAPELVAVADHRHALREQHRCQQVPLLPFAQRADLGIVGRSLGAAVPAQVVVLAVVIVLAVVLVVLLVVGHEVVEREAVVRRDEVDARVRPPSRQLVQVGAPGQAVRELAEGLVRAAPVVAHRVPELPVPLRPERREVADLVAAFADVPRLGDQLDLRQHRVLVDDVEERGQPIDFVQLARQRCREIEAEAVDVHLEHPVAQAVHDQLQHLRALHVERVAAAGEVRVVPHVVGNQAIVRDVVDPLERQRRAHLIALGRVVVDDVEDHLEAGGVQRAHHALELAHGARGRSRRGEPPLRRKVAEAVVAPVLGESFLLEVAIARVMMHGHQLHRGDAELAQVLQRRLGRERLVGSAQMLRNGRMELREAAHVHLVDHRVVPRCARRPILSPGERRIDDGGERRVGGVVAVVEGAVGVRIADAIAKHLVGPANRTRDRFRVWIHDNLVGVETLPHGRVVWAVHAVTVELVRPHIGQEPVPHHVGMLVQRDALALQRRVRRVEQA